MNIRVFFTSAVACLLTFAASYSPAQEVSGTDVLRAASALLADQNSFQFKASVHTDATFESEQQVMDMRYTVAYKRPDKVALELDTQDQADARFISNAGELTTFIPDYEQFTVKALDQPVSEVVRNAAFGPFTLATPLLAELVKEQPFGEALNSESEVAYVGKDTVDGMETHHVRFSVSDFEMDLWVDAGKQPLIRRAVPDVDPLVEEFRADDESAELALDITFSDWDLGEVADAKFAFDAPEGAAKVRSFGPQPEAYALLGKPAPEFTLDLMGDGELSIAEKGDDEVLILDFWATWCGPCRKAMPIIDRVAGEFSDKGVRLYAVNLEEEPSTIKSFLDNQGLDVTVALDKSGEVANMYKAHSIPQTVLIGKDGTVQSVHVGVSPSLEQELRNELNALVTGKDLVDGAS